MLEDAVEDDDADADDDYDYDYDADADDDGEDDDVEDDDGEDDDAVTPYIILKVFQICLHVENNKQTTMQRTNKDAIKVYFEYQQFFKDRHQHLLRV